jgi:hypothetical protein
MLPHRLQRLAPWPLVLLVAAGIAAGILGYATDGPDSIPASDSNTRDSAHVRGIVQDVDSNSLTLSVDGPSQKLRLSSSLAVETLQPATTSALRTGDWLNAGAVEHAQTLFAITGLVVIPQDNLRVP